MSKLLNPEERKLIGETYCHLMLEILVRDELILNALNNAIPVTLAMKHIPKIHQVITGEFCYFQLRMICELIALACLTAHGDIQETKSNRLQESYQADLIIKALTKLHSKFYPTPSKQSEMKLDGKWQRTYLADGFLTKQELLTLYRECGNFLHWGSHSLVVTKQRPMPDLSRIQQYSSKIWRLLDHHEIQLIDPNYQIIGILKDKTYERPQFAFAEKLGAGDWIIRDAIDVNQPARKAD
jgi:hypothetical protein